MMNFIRHKPLHAFLIGLYIIAFIFVNNVDQVSVPMTYRSMAVNVVVTAMLYGVSYLVLRSALKAGIYTTLVLVGFFCYGLIYDQLERLFYQGLWPFSHIHRFLIVAYIFLYLLLLILLYRSKRSFVSLNYGLNVFVLAVFAINIVSLLTSFKKAKDNGPANPLLAGVQSMPAKAAPPNAPDVYYIIMDGFASEQTLKRFYALEQSKMYQYLRQKGFYVADSSRANYPFTRFSLSSSLNLSYLENGLHEKANTLIDQNLVSFLFKKNGYRVVTIKSGFAVTERFAFADKILEIEGPNEFENRLLGLTVLRLDDVMGITTYMRLKSQLDLLPQLVHEKGPKFTFVHIVAPHPPYVLDANGRRAVRGSLSDAAWEPRSNYLAQMEYVQSQVIKLVDSAINNSAVPPIILVQSDHGPWIQDKDVENVYNARTGILNAYYVPDSLKARLYPSISPVNSFRLVLSSVYGVNYPALPDKPASLQELANDPTFKLYNQ